MVDKRRFINECVYCGETKGELTDEHIIPYSLQGDPMIYKASCKRCEDITKKFETIVAQTMLQAFRAKIGVRTRNKKKRPKEFRVRIEKPNGGHETVMLPTAVHPGSILLLTWGLPRWLGGTAGTGVPTMWKGVMHTVDATMIGETMKRLDAVEMDTGTFHALPFARLLAKIAYTYAVFTKAIRPAPEHWAARFIRGDTDDYFDFVGGDDVPDDKPDSVLVPGATVVLHRIRLRPEEYRGALNLVASIRLFAPFDGPLYKVVVGRKLVSERAA